MSALKEALIIHPAVEMVSFEDLTDELRESLNAEPGDMAVSRSGTRSVSRVIDVEMAALLLHFRTATRVPHAVLAFATELGEEPSEVLRDALPVLGELHAAGVLATELELDEPEHMTITPGDTFVGFEVEAILQAFADSVVFRVRHGDGLAILKAAPVDATSSMDPGFENEAARLTELAGASFVPALLDRGETNGYHWLLIEFYPGVAVNAAAERLRLDRDQRGLSQLTRRVAQAYAELHEQGVVHGDVHPNNILVDADNQVSLIDFGVGRRLDQDSRAMSRAGVAFFTEPEVAIAALGGEPKPAVTALSEQYTVAAVLYELVTGSSHRPQLFNHRELVEDRAHNPAQTFSEVGAEAPTGFEAPLLQALSIEPQDRFRSMAEFTRALPQLECDRPTSTTPAIGAFADMNFQLIDPDGSLYEQGLPTGPKASVALGSAGIAYVLVREAVRTGSTSALMQAEAWMAQSRRSADDELAWTDAAGEFDLDSVSPASVLHRDAGHDFVACILAAALGRSEQLDRALDSLSRWADTPAGQWEGDLTIGTLSLVPALAQIRSLTADPAQHARIDATAAQVLAANPLRLSDITPTSNLGFAHGATGRAFAHLLWQQSTGTPGADWATYLDAVLQRSVRTGRGTNIPWNIGAGQPPSSMPGWCNGAAGILTALTRAADVSGDDRWLHAALGFAWHAYDARESGHDICCGTAGRAYALAEYGVAINETVWVDRARNMVERSLSRAAHADPDHNPQQSLIKGSLGLALLIRDLDDLDRLGLPIFGPLV